jgi:hypothetical protein
MLSALPAFALGAVCVRSLAVVGINEVWSFAVLMPLLIFAWFYLVGALIDRWIGRRLSAKSR